MDAITLGGALTSMLSGIPVRSRPGRSGAVRRTGAPVLRGSMEAGTFEESFFAIPGAGETDRLLRAARKTLDTARGLRRVERQGERKLSVAERTIAALQASAVRVFEELLTLSRLNKGKVFPTYEYLADRTNYSRATVTRSLSALEAVGFIVRQRRFKRVDGEGRGPRYEQTSNAYRTMLPARVLAILPRWMRPAPKPVDAEERQREQIESTKAMLAGLSCKELAEATVSGPLGRMLARLGAGVDRAEREAHYGSKPLIDSSDIRKSELA